jgi:hypothetical protein
MYGCMAKILAEIFCLQSFRCVFFTTKEMEGYIEGKKLAEIFCLQSFCSIKIYSHAIFKYPI